MQNPLYAKLITLNLKVHIMTAYEYKICPLFTGWNDILRDSGWRYHSRIKSELFCRDRPVGSHTQIIRRQVAGALRALKGHSSWIELQKPPGWRTGTGSTRNFS